MPSKSGSFFYLKKRDSVALTLVVLTIVSFIVFSTIYSDYVLTNQQLFIGGFIGFVCGIYVICRLQTDPRFQTPIVKLTFYRVLAEIGISIRFMLSPIINNELCGDYAGCDSVKDQSVNEHMCAPWSAMLQFFLVASELWFLCTAFDFAVTLSNPFSPFADRMKKYHVFCWGVALVTALAVASDKQLHGVWYASSDVDSTTICWFKVNGGSLTDVNVIIWIFFYAPLLIIYLYAIYVIVSAYSMLSYGIQVTFLHRARVLFFSQLLLVIYICYWAFLLALYIGVFIVKRESFWNWMLFFIPARGILGVFILFCTQFTNIFQDRTADSKGGNPSSATFVAAESEDLNSALQNEIVAYATVGIKESALLTHKQSFDDTENEDDRPSCPSQNDFWIKIPDDLVQLEKFRGIANVVDVEFQDILKVYAEARSVEKLKDLLYRTPDNVQIDERESSSSTVSSRSLSKPNGRSESTAAAGAATGAGLTLQQLLKDDDEPRLSTTDPLAAESDRHESMLSGYGHRLKLLFSKIKASLKRNSIILSSTPSSVHFTEYSPSIFYEVRMLYGVEGIYPQSFEKPIKLHLAEGGASNALFFFSECRKFMAKSCTAEEMITVRTHAGELRDHFRQNRNSLISKIFGAYKLQVYSTDLYFIVTNNVLLADENESITEKYDLKGSSVHRYMKLPRDGEIARCRLCGNAFTYNSKNHFRSEREHSVNPPTNSSLIFNESVVNEESPEDDRPINDPRTVSSSAVSTASPLPSAHEKRMSRRMSRRLSSSTDGPKRKVQIQQTVSDFSTVCPLFRHVPDAVMKDNDFRGKARIRLPPNIGDELIEQLHEDCEFLANVYQVMDYSLLVGVFKKVIEVKEEDVALSEDISGHKSLRSMRGLHSRWKAGEFVVDYSYYMGIIDYQQPYGIRKKLETWYKVNIERNRYEEISCIPPVPYMERFLTFMEDLIF